MQTAGSREATDPPVHPRYDIGFNSLWDFRTRAGPIREGDRGISARRGDGYDLGMAGNMIDFLFSRKREDVRRLLSTRMNVSFLRRFRYGKRQEARGPFTEVVWVIPYDAGGRKPEFSRAFAAVTLDASPEGLSLLQSRPSADRKLLVGLPDAAGVQFLICEVEHSTPMGYGFHHLGLHPTALIDVDPADVAKIERRLAELASSNDLPAD